MPIEDHSKQGIVEKSHQEPLGMNIANKDIMKSLTELFDPKDDKVRQTEMPDALSKTANQQPEASKGLPTLEQDKSGHSHTDAINKGHDKGEGYAR